MRPLLLGLGWFPDELGGSNRYFRDLIERLQADGELVRGVVIGSQAPGRDDVVVAAAPTDGIGRRLRRFKAVAEALGRSADLIDVHFALYAFLPVVVGRLRGKPLVVHFHGPWAEESESANSASRFAVFAKRVVERAVYRRAGEMITLSGAFKRLLVERYGVRPWLVHVIPPGVDLERFSPGDREAARVELGLDEEDWVACCVRRLIPRTGVDVLLRAWAHLDRKGVLLIAGEGAEQQSLERLAQELGVAESVRFLGGVSEAQLVAVYRAADVSVVPSTALEGFGLVVLESLACGTPVIASDVGGLPEALAGVRPRSIVPAGDATALAERLVLPLPDRASCRVAAERHSWERSIRRHREVYERVLGGITNRKLRVVYLDHTARLSGAELALVRLLPALDGIEKHVILAEDGPLVGRLLEAGVSVEVMPLGRGAAEFPREHVGPGSLGSREAIEAAVYALRLAVKLRRLRPDLVHTNSLKAAFYGGLAGRLARIPVVSHVHDRIADDYLPPRAVRMTRSALARFPHAVVAPSRTVAETLGRSAAIIPCPTGPPVVHAHGDPARPLTVGIVGRIAPWKGQHIFIEAFARAFPDGDARGVVIGAPLFGSVEEGYLDELHALTLKLGLHGRVRFAGFVEDVDTELGALDILVHASVIPEPFGQVVVEGMAAGLTVVAANAGGPTEIIDDGVDGLLYPAGDSSALATLLSRLDADPGLRQRLGRAAEQRAAEYAPSAIASRVGMVYADLVRAPSSARVETPGQEAA